MTFIPQARIDRITARITALEAQQTALDAAIVAGNEIGEYRFDSGEGSQRVRYRSIASLTKASYNLDRLIESLYRKLQGTGIVNVNLRR
jgi:coenzyme F420-reducing hydrogenase delta subunit